MRSLEATPLSFGVTAEPLFPVRRPDVLDLRRPAQELAAFGFGPVGRCGRGPGRLEIAGGKRLDLSCALRVADIPNRIHGVVLGHRLAQDVRLSGDDVDDAGGNI